MNMIVNKSALVCGKTARPTISVIVVTYNWPEALSHVLYGLAQQMLPTDEVLIADDGSDERTKVVIDQHRPNFSCSFTHVWHEDKGFRAAAIRNRALAQAKGDYVLFMDGDCRPLAKTIAQHRNLAETGYFVSGNRLLCNKAWTERLLAQAPRALPGVLSWLALRCTGKINRLMPLWRLPLGRLRKLKPQRWQGAKTCNLGVWRKDLLRVNGFDEGFEGWGYEDSELVARLIHSGISHKNGRFGTAVLHFWHPERSRDHENANWQRFICVLNERRTQAAHGLISLKGYEAEIAVKVETETAV